MKIGIVGHAADKFTPGTEAQARRVIAAILARPGTILVSGGCHLGGIDIWAEEEADRLGIEKIIHLPVHRRWEGGYKQRNIKIAQDSDQLLVIVVTDYPPGYRGMRFTGCYHCKERRSAHVKSGGCWTGNVAEQLGKAVTWILLNQEEPGT